MVVVKERAVLAVIWRRGWEGGVRRMERVWGGRRKSARKRVGGDMMAMVGVLTKCPRLGIGDAVFEMEFRSRQDSCLRLFLPDRLHDHRYR